MRHIGAFLDTWTISLSMQSDQVADQCTLAAHPLMAAVAFVRYGLRPDTTRL